MLHSTLTRIGSGRGVKILVTGERTQVNASQLSTPSENTKPAPTHLLKSAQLCVAI